MKEKIKNLLNNSWIVGIGTGIIVLILPSIIQSAVQKISFITVLKKWRNGLVTFFIFGVPLWIILIILIITVVVFHIYNKLKRNGSTTLEKENIPDFLSFKTMKYKDWVIRWSYTKLPENEYIVNNIIPIYECGCELVRGKYISCTTAPKFTCPNCGKEYPYFFDENIKSAEKLIEYNISTGKYKNIDSGLRPTSYEVIRRNTVK
jgi:hypothetical protein